MQHRPLQHWLMKSEPGVFGIEHLQNMPEQRDHWDGIRNYQARNFMRDQMSLGDPQASPEPWRWSVPPTRISPHGTQQVITLTQKAALRIHAGSWLMCNFAPGSNGLYAFRK